jgi:hypothetical protein
MTRGARPRRSAKVRTLHAGLRRSVPDKLPSLKSVALTVSRASPPVFPPPQKNRFQSAAEIKNTAEMALDRETACRNAAVREAPGPA